MILVTGGSGYIGSAICHELKKRGLSYNIMTRKPHDANCIEYDLLGNNSSELADIINAHTHIIHCAWFVDRKTYLNSPNNFDWISATMKLAALADKRQVKHFNSLGTCLEYKPSQLPKTIASELGADSNYAAAKIATFRGLEQLLAKKEISFSWSRIFHIYGGNEHPDKLIPTINRCIQKNHTFDFKAANQVIDLSPVEKTAEDLVDISLAQKQGAFNVCSGVAKTIKQIAIDMAGEEFSEQYFKFSGNSITRNNLAGERFV